MSLRKLFAIVIACGVGVGLVLFGIAFYFRESFAAAGDLGSSPARTWSVLILALPALVLGWALSFVFANLTESCDRLYWAAIILFGIVVTATALISGYEWLPLSFKGMLPSAILAGIAAPFPSAIKAWMEE